MKARLLSVFNIVRDLLKGPNNLYWDLGRIMAVVSVAATLVAAYHNYSLGLPIELGPTGLAGGLAAIITASAALILVKDRASNNGGSQ